MENSTTFDNVKLQYFYPENEEKNMEENVVIEVTIEEGCAVPVYKTIDSAGMDLSAKEDVILTPFKPAIIKTGLRMAIPQGYEGQVRPRSGLSLKGVTVYNSPGTIDSDYRGEVGVILIYIPPLLAEGGNVVEMMAKGYEVKKGDRVAQLGIAKVDQANLIPSLFLSDTDRGEGGFGSTGK